MCQSKRITLPCDCKCCMLVIEKMMWDEHDIDYVISVQDSRFGQNYNTVWGRLKRAFKILFGKPIYYNDLILNGEHSFQALIRDMVALAETKYVSASEGVLP